MPKKYINPEILKSRFTNGYDDYFPLWKIEMFIDDAPAADVKEVKHGKWIKDVTKRRDDGEIYDYCCSECQGEAYEGSYGNNDVFSDYCHHCGTKMDGKVKMKNA